MSEQPKPTIAVVGCGRIAKTHAANLASEAQLVFTSRSAESAERLARRFGGERANSFDEVLDRSDIGAVVLCTPLEHHAEQVTAALQAGKSVLVEKPMASSPAEVEAIGHALAGRPPGALTVAENYLYRPSLGRLKHWLPAIGAIRRVQLSKRTQQPVSGWRTAHGALLEGGIHFVALLGALLDETPSAIHAKFPGDDGDSPERSSEVRVDYPSGAVGEVRYAWNVRSLPGGVFQHSRVEGEEGRIVFESNGLYIGVRGAREFRFRFGPLEDLMGFRALARDFLRSLADPDRRPRSDFERARRDLGIVFAAYAQRPAEVAPDGAGGDAAGG